MRFPPCRPGAAAPGRPFSSFGFFVATALAAIGCRCDRLHDIATRSDVNGGSARPARQALSALVRSFAHRLFLPWPFLFRAAFGDRPLTETTSFRVNGADVRVDHRSEEHTSELQSLMRLSYAVFCLKKKHKRTQDKIS